MTDLLEDVPDMTGRKRLKPSILKTAYIPHNSITNKLFVEDTTLNFQIGECKANEVLFAKGHESDPSLGSYAIISENYYLKIVLHEQNNTNSLVFKSNNPILQTRKRPLTTLKFNATTKNLRLLLESVDEAISIDTSQVHYRTALNQFTGLKQTTDNIKIGRGVTLPHGTFGLYYLNAENKEETQDETNEKYQVIKDERILDPLGKIVFLTDRDPFINAYEIDEDGANPTLKHSFGSNANTVQYVHDGDGIVITKSDSVIYKNESGVIKSSTGLTNAINGTLSPSKQFLTYSYTEDPHTKDLESIAGHFFDANLGTSSYKTTPFEYKPNSNDLVLCARYKLSAPHVLVIKSRLSGSETVLYTMPFSPTDAGLRITRAKFSKDGNKVCFNIYMNNAGTDFRAYVVNSDGTGLTLLAQTNYTTTPTEVWAFSPDGEKVLLSKTVSDIGYTNKKQLFIRDLTTNEEKQITFHNSNNYMADWKA